jgi:hypothetical protein
MAFGNKQKGKNSMIMFSYFDEKYFVKKSL